jgi:Predicted integral membrane protein (DUF2269)
MSNCSFRENSMTTAALLIAAHIICTTLGYGGLIAANVALAFVARRGEPHSTAAAVGAVLGIERLFGPLLGVGVLLGMAILAALHLPGSAPWLIVTYVVIVAGIVLQGAVAVPFHLRYLRAAESGAVLAGENAARTAAWIAVAFAAMFVLLVTLMVARPLAL